MIRERIAEALKSGDSRRLQEAIDSWLSGLSTDEELAAVVELDIESFDLPSRPGRGGVGVKHGKR